MKLAIVAALLASAVAVLGDGNTQQEWVALVSKHASLGSKISAGALSEYTTTMKKAIRATGADITSYHPEIGMATIIGPAQSITSVKKMADVVGVFRSVKRRFIPEADKLLGGAAGGRRLHEDHDTLVDAARSAAARLLPAFKEPDYRPLQWSRKAIGADRALNAGLKGKGATVAVLDTGFYLDHPAIKRYDQSLSYNFIVDEQLAFNYTLANNPGDLDFSHGTHTASTVAGADLGGKGTIGVAPEANLVLVKVLSDMGFGYDPQVVGGILYAVAAGVDIISMSLGSLSNVTGSPEDGYTASDVSMWIQMYNRVFSFAHDRGVTVVVAGGNDAVQMDTQTDLFAFFAENKWTISVAATGPTFWAKDPKNAKLNGSSSYTNTGSAIDFSAPGGNNMAVNRTAGATQETCSYTLNTGVFSTSCYRFDYVLSAALSKEALFSMPRYGIPTRYAFVAGTSMATPHVAGVAALIRGKKKGRISVDQMKEYLKQCSYDLGDKGKDPIYGHGLISASKVVDLKF
ncbi:peptidase S8/S53 domain-containing protein [Tribonema minus]|uniref:subtilisin n=1 Tax=Tribonema minus TaxID=303371 RepID=A0A836C9R8_9STRA|nr:peptidase S8/S53 domain-containing protein [Tribonema minus]